ncbi:MAG: peptidase MA family metallohydrolase [Myxococcota bacterium]|nr:peptidase MA family metallohydrolase [Myxococcota bacterium]
MKPSKPVTSSRRRSAIRWARAGLAVALLLAPLPASAGRGADGEFEKRTSSHFVLYQDVAIDETGGLRGSRRFEQQVLDELERAYDQLDTFLGLRPRRKMQVVVYDAGVFDGSFASRFSFRPAGFYNGSIHVRAHDVLSVQLARVLRHELVHAAFHAAAPSLVLPAWFNEGVAEWFEARALSKRRLSGAELDYLVRAHRQGALFSVRDLSSRSFAGFSQNAATLAYLQSYGMIEYLARRHGDRAVRELCERVVRSRDVERSMQRTFRFGVQELAARFADDLG